MAIIDDPTAVFQCTLYTGNGGTQSITNTGNSNLQPNLTWIKARSATTDNQVFDSVRGTGKLLVSNTTDAEYSGSNLLTAFNSNGFSLGDHAPLNGNGVTFVSWNWKEQAGVFDVVGYTGNGNARTISHNLGSVPKFMICKDRDGVKNWGTYHEAIGPGSDAGYINNTVVPEANTNFWNNTNPTSSVFSVGTDNTYNGNGIDYVIYLFGDSSISKCGSYTGNNNSDGTFIYTGFSPAFIFIKKTSGTGGWQMRDNKRTSYGNETLNLNYANASSAEQTTDGFDFLSNGFKWRNQASDCNGSGNYIYAAFAQNPFVTSTDNGSIPATAR